MNLAVFKEEITLELHRILQYWMCHSKDDSNDGFIGRIDYADKVNHQAEKGSVLNSRILWTFAAAYNRLAGEEYLLMAKRAFDYIRHCFVDPHYGGVYWSVDYKGNPLQTKKQVYAQAFAIYAFSEYYIASGDEDAKVLAIQLYIG